LLTLTRPTNSSGTPLQSFHVLSDALSRELKTRQVAMTKQVKRTGNVEELKEDPNFELILKALNCDKSGFQRKMTWAI